MNKELEELKKEEDRLLLLLMQNRGRQRAINEAAFCEKNGFYIGDTVQFYDGKIGVVLPFLYIHESTKGPSYYEVALVKVDGSRGLLRKKIWQSDIKENKVSLIEKAAQ